jgi:hypothetical protein
VKLETLIPSVFADVPICERRLALTLIEETIALGRLHVTHVLEPKGRLGLRVELDVHHHLAEQDPFYAHFLSTTAFLVYFYKYAPPGPAFRCVRCTLVCCNLLVFVMFIAWSCIPPCLLPFERFGFIDTVHIHQHASAWTASEFQS